MTTDTTTDQFLRDAMSSLLAAERALHDGDVEPRLNIWSHAEPVTVFGAWQSAAGWDCVRELFESLASRFSDCAASDMDIVAAGASGDLAYTVAYERITTRVDDTPRSYTLRATQVYRREDGAWKVVHRHGEEVLDGTQLLDAVPASAWTEERCTITYVWS